MPIHLLSCKPLPSLPIERRVVGFVALATLITTLALALLAIIYHHHALRLTADLFGSLTLIAATFSLWPKIEACFSHITFKTQPHTPPLVTTPPPIILKISHSSPPSTAPISPISTSAASSHIFPSISTTSSSLLAIKKEAEESLIPKLKETEKVIEEGAQKIRLSLLDMTTNRWNNELLKLVEICFSDPFKRWHTNAEEFIKHEIKQSNDPFLTNAEKHDLAVETLNRGLGEELSKYVNSMNITLQDKAVFCFVKAWVRSSLEELSQKEEAWQKMEAAEISEDPFFRFCLNLPHPQDRMQNIPPDQKVFIDQLILAIRAAIEKVKKRFPDHRF